MKKYYEVEFGTSKDLSDSYSICIIGERKPSIEEAQEFCKTDLQALGYEHVTDVLEISADEAHRFFDMENEATLPIFA